MRKHSKSNLHHCQQSNRVSNDLLIWKEIVQGYKSEYIQYNTIQYNTIQYNTIQYNTVQYNALHFNSMQHSAIQSVCQCLSSCFYFIITRPSFNAVESMDASTWIVEPKPRIIMRSNIYDHRSYCYQSLLLLEVEWIKSIWPFLFKVLFCVFLRVLK